MFAQGLLKGVLVGVVVLSLAIGDALARKGGGGGGGGRGGGGGGGGRSSWSGGGGGGGGGGRSSFSRGGGSSSRSFSGNSSRSFSGGSSRSFSGGSSRSWSAGNGGGRGQGGGPSRSFSGGGDGGNSRRAFRGDAGGSTRTFSSDSGRSFRSMSENGRANRSFNNDGGNAFGSLNADGRSTRSLNDNDRVSSSQFQRSRGEGRGDSSDSVRSFRREGWSADVGGNFSGGRGEARSGRNSNREQLRAFLDSRDNNRALAAAGRGDGSGAATGERRSSYRQGPNNQGGNADGDRRGVRRGDWDRASLANRAEGNSGDATRRDRADDAAFDRNRFRSGDEGNRQASYNEFRTRNRDDGDGREGRGGRGRGDDGEVRGRGNGHRFADGGSKNGNKDWHNWSKHRGGDDRTRRWYANSGFGDHRGRGKGGDWKGDRDKWGNQVRHDWNNKWWKKHGKHDWNWHRRNNWRYVPFAYGWWAGYPRYAAWYYWNDWGWRRDPWFWWRPCAAPVLTTWIDFGWKYPCYWDYGPGQYVTYYNNTVYVDNQRYGTTLDYYAQVRRQAHSAPNLTPEQLAGIEWLPLGVFAVTRPGAADSHELMQLAVSKDGMLSGTLFDERTNTARPLVGMVDQATQRAAWHYADAPNDGLVLETSIYNLTEPECTAMAHFGPLSHEVWQLVRLEQPAQDANAAVPPPAAAVPPQRAPALPPQ